MGSYHNEATHFCKPNRNKSKPGFHVLTSMGNSCFGVLATATQSATILVLDTTIFTCRFLRVTVLAVSLIV